MIDFVKRARKGEGKGHLMFKNWTPRHDAIVMDKASGMRNTDIAEKYDMAESTVALICTSRKGKIMLAAVSESVLKEKYAELPELRKQAIIKGTQRIFDFLANDELHEAAPFKSAALDMKAVEVLSAQEKVATQAGPVFNNIQVTVLNNPDKRDALAEGIKRALMVEEIHAQVTGASVGEQVDKRDSVKLQVVE